MDRPIGNAVGNWLEMSECIDVIHGGGPADLEWLTAVQAGQMLMQAGVPGADRLRAGVEQASMIGCFGPALCPALGFSTRALADGQHEESLSRLCNRLLSL